MSDTDNKKRWWITVEGERRGPYPDYRMAFKAAKDVKRAARSLKVALVNPQGTATTID